MGLNEAQKDAVLHKDGPCLVLAGPGSGKTLTIVNRVKYLIEGYKVRPEEILVVTFTRFAAAEMRSRLCSLMGKERLPVTDPESVIVPSKSNNTVLISITVHLSSLTVLFFLKLSF